MQRVFSIGDYYRSMRLFKGSLAQITSRIGAVAVFPVNDEGRLPPDWANRAFATLLGSEISQPDSDSSDFD
ncbi:hypothetical protein [Rhizobium sp. RU36D]|uniref:hypothetical protein n=1 Tax=Rhizobium sp. RU36D TaxID=1907415 RepID=UPI0009D90AC3|nr:hypothetical protein [Rhizobium sp. RU36D]SMC60961.1 hypothetical protein SAMN05880593_103218 [Rhizobium sp. RU36D]